MYEFSMFYEVFGCIHACILHVLSVRLTKEVKGAPGGFLFILSQVLGILTYNTKTRKVKTLKWFISINFRSYNVENRKMVPLRRKLKISHSLVVFPVLPTRRYLN